ncbi:SMI1/KNR4 family protein [Streptomyces sp. XD-27]|uniref:SMI1/KNR4 family protein n=1 Tax=Streptomyces sp. XD-27 TaxID=3062779 RepID=UPI0026F443CA|nr:SMI1/KNR4 family protein [Streptomyces sp. XD-27]WKX69120.1 SMI1/KNR4 family protein [Streptomyces sp. XD-27]
MGGTWAGVRERVLALRDAPRWWAVFGADYPGYGHDFELLPVLTEEQLHAVERRLGTELPEEYRTFLLQVGAGGAGPDYGLFPIKPPGPDAPPATGHCALPFRPGCTAEFDEHEWAEPQRADYPDDEAFAAAYAAWEASRDELYDALTEGTLCISSQGCAYYSLLVVTGPECGTIWEDVRAAGEGVAPVELRGRTGHVTFAQWYLNWLDRAERRAWDETTEPPPRLEFTSDARSKGEAV